MGEKRLYRALGTMSGTSMDGVDAAVIDTDGHVIHGFGRTAFHPYTDLQRDTLRAAMGKWSGPEVDAAAAVVEDAHAACLSDFPEAEVIGFHGQTTAHDPARGATCQIGSGAILAEALDRPVVWDFRTSDMELGGQGAPLAPFFHFALAQWLGATAPVAFLNLGGVGNITIVDPAQNRPEAPGACLAFDTGPANARIDDMLAQRSNHTMDEGGALALAGRVDADILQMMLNDPYFAKIPPKSLDRDDFLEWGPLTQDLNLHDAAATLAAGSAGAVARAFEHLGQTPTRMLVAGGGRKNAAMMEMLSALLPCPVAPVEDAGLDGDMIEAQAFAYLAVRVMRGLPTSAPGTTGVPAPIGGGRVSRPGDLAGLEDPGAPV